MMTPEEIESELKQLTELKQQVLTEFEQVKQQLFAKFEQDKEQLVASVNSKLGQIEGQTLIYQKWLEQLGNKKTSASANGQKEKV